MAGRRQHGGRGETVNEALVLLALVWAALLVPAALRARAASPHATVGGFERAMDVLRSEAHADDQRTVAAGDPSGVPDRQSGVATTSDAARAPAGRPEDPVIARRRLWFVRALAASGATLLLAIIVGGWTWLPAIVIIAMTAGYTAVLRHLKLQRDAAREVVRELDLTGADPLLRERAGQGSDAVVVEREPVAVGQQAEPAGRSWAQSGTVRLRRWDG